MVASWEYSL